MTTSPFQGKQFQSAAFRRAGKPLIFQWQHWPLNAPQPIEVELEVDPNVDLVRMGAAFGSFAQNLEKFRSKDSDMEALSVSLKEQLPKVKASLRDCLIPTAQLLFDTVSDSIDLSGLSGIIMWMMGELSGADPTKQASSLNGSAPTGNDSTDGAPPTGSTPQAFPSPAV